MLKYRILTALILIPLVVMFVCFSSESLFAFFSAAIVLIAAWEMSGLVSLKHIESKIIYVFLTLLILAGSLFIPISQVLIAAAAWWVLALLFVMLYPKCDYLWGGSRAMLCLIGWLTLIPCWRALLFIHAQPAGAYSLLYLFVLIWGADTTAYCVGRKWGARKLMPAVSPNKSVEGAAGALVVTCLLSVLILAFVKTPREIFPGAIMISMGTVIFSIVGDLFESMLKRHAHVKDSGNLLPGHGGLLDRIDSLTAAAPVFAFGGLLLKWYLSQ